jgi:hypothetical protein
MSFDQGGVMTRETPPTRELAARESDGIHVLLLWHPGEDALTVTVDDARAGDRFQLAVAPDRALEVFYHPFAYAAYGGFASQTSTSRRNEHVSQRAANS